MAEAAAHVGADPADRTMMSWQPVAGSADADLLPDLGMLVPRSRDLARNNGIAGSGIQTLKDNIVGATLRLSSMPDYRVLGWTREQAREWGNRVEAEFRSYMNSTECDAARTLNLLGLTLQALGGVLLNGDALALPLWLPRPGHRWSTRLMMVESDRLATPPTLRHRDDIRGGVQFDRYGAPVGYWILKRHPGDRYAYGHGIGYGFSLDEWEYVQAFTPWGRPRVLHLHDKDRTGQSRGKPIFTAVMREFHMAGKYATTELQAAVANSMIAAFLESDLGPEATAQLFGEDPRGAWKQSVGEVGQVRKIHGGSIINLPVGAKLSPYTPGRPNAGFDAFMTSTLRGIAAGMNIPYELLLKDFSRTSYSSARASMLEAWRYFNGRRRWLTDYWLRPIFTLWLEEAVDTGRIEAPNFLEYRHAYSECRFIFSGRGWVDPVREAQAAQIRMQNGLSTLEMECAEQGLDWEDVLEQQAHEAAKRAELGLQPVGAAPPAGNQGDNQDAQPDAQPASGQAQADAAPASAADMAAAIAGLADATRAMTLRAPEPPHIHIAAPAPRAVKRIPVRDPQTGMIVEVHEVEVDDIDAEQAEHEDKGREN